DRTGDQAQQSVARVLARSPRVASSVSPGTLAPTRPRRRPVALILVAILALVVVVASLLVARRFGPIIGAAPTATTGAAAQAPAPTATVSAAARAAAPTL